MRRLTILFALTAPLWAQSGFDFKSLDKLDALSSNKTKVTLDEGLLKLAAGFVGGNKSPDHPDSIQSLVANLKGVYVRTWEFEKDGQYSPSDVEPFRSYLKQQQWSMIVESQEGKDVTEVYVQQQGTAHLGGVAIISVEPRELTVVYISGTLTMSDIQKLQGNLGIPGFDLNSHRMTNSSPSKNKKDKEEDEEHEEQQYK